jgi:hypothetical protein
LGKNPSCGQESLLSTLDIQTGISWAFDIESKRFKAQIHLRVPEYNFDEGFKVR